LKDSSFFSCAVADPRNDIKKRTSERLFILVVLNLMIAVMLTRSSFQLGDQIIDEAIVIELFHPVEIPKRQWIDVGGAEFRQPSEAKDGVEAKSIPPSEAISNQEISREETSREKTRAPKITARVRLRRR